MWKLYFLVCATVLSVFSEAHGQDTSPDLNTYLEELGCDHIIIQSQPFFNDGASVRLSDTAVCADHETETAYFVGTAAAMHRWTIVGRNSAPWLNLVLQDRDSLATVWEAGDRLGLVEISECGGYAAIGRKIPYEIAMASYSYQVRMGAANDGACGSGKSTSLNEVFSRIREIVDNGGTCTDCPAWQQDLLAIGKTYAASDGGQ